MADIFYGLIGFTILLLPGLLCRFKKHPQTNAIFLLSIAGAGLALFVPLIGLLIWLAALIWALTGKKSG